jgi:hypothetical protein
METRAAAGIDVVTADSAAAAGLLPNKTIPQEDRLSGLSPFQERWNYEGRELSPVAEVKRVSRASLLEIGMSHGGVRLEA